MHCSSPAGNPTASGLRATLTDCVAGYHATAAQGTTTDLLHSNYINNIMQLKLLFKQTKHLQTQALSQDLRVLTNINQKRVK